MLATQKPSDLVFKQGTFWNDGLTVTPTPVPLEAQESLKIENCTYVEIDPEAQKLFAYIQRYIGNTTQLNSYQINPSKLNWDSDSDSDSDEPEERPAVKGQRTIIKMGIGLHTIDHEGTPIRVLYTLVGSPVSSSGEATIKEKIVLIVEELGKQSVLQNFCDFIVNFYEKTIPDRINVYQYNAEYHYWHVTSSKAARSIDSIILPHDVKHLLVKDIDEFIAKDTYQWYKAHGVPYKRSYLLYGPPGSGKSSIIQAIAGKYKRNICFVQPMKEKFTDETFSTCIQVAPKKALIVLEDIDAYFRKDRKTNHQSCPLTFSGLLNGLDGVGNTDGQIFIITTNFIDRLDDALIRSGRVDLRIEFPMMTLDLAEDMFRKFYPNQIAWATIFRENLEKRLSSIGRKLCMADLQQHFIAHRLNSAERASEDFDDITGDEYNRLAELAEKISKGEEENEDKGDSDKEDNNNSSSNNNNSTTVEEAVPNYLTTSIGFAFGSGLALLATLLGYKYIKNES